MIRRARLFLLVAGVVAGLVLVTNFPLSALLHERSAVAAENAQLTALRAAGQALSAEVHALSDSAGVARLAHQDYGLVSPGQRSIVVLPGPAGTRAGGVAPHSAVSPVGSLADGPIPASDLLPSDSMLGPASVRIGGLRVKGPGFWSQVINRLEFWHSVF